MTEKELKVRVRTGVERQKTNGVGYRVAAQLKQGQ